MLKKYGALFAVGIGAALVLGYFAKQGAKAVAEVAGTKLNPYSSQNAVYENVIGGAGRALTSDANFTLGGWLYDKLH